MHYEQQTPNSASQYTSPVSPPHGLLYDDVWATTLFQPDGPQVILKLMIGTKAFSGLVTSSIRVDEMTEHEVGPSTFKFTLDMVSSGSCKIFVDVKSWESAMKIASNPLVDSIRNSGRISQLRQLRIKFHHLSTYGASRLSLLNAPSQLPYTVFTYHDYSDGRITDGKIASRFMSNLTTNVLVNGADARLNRPIVEKLHNDTSDQGKIQQILNAVIQLFDQDNSIHIIGNSDLNVQAEALALYLATYISQANKKVGFGFN